MNRIKELRLKKGLSLKELSENTGLAVSSLSAYELDKRNPKIEIWKKLADYFDVSIPYLQGLDSTEILKEFNVEGLFRDVTKENELNADEAEQLHQDFSDYLEKRAKLLKQKKLGD